jgi:aminoglycoside phosphotransferase (APT) family kinase protein
MTLGERLAEGRMAEVFAYGEGRVLKLFRAEANRWDIEHEIHNTRTVRDAGFDAPRIDDEIEVEDRPGIVFERIAGPSMLALLMQEPARSEELACILAEVHARMHTHQGDGLQSQRQKIVHRIKRESALTQADRHELVRRIASLDDGTVICHGDFHPDNVLITASGPRVIDWLDATSGSALADVARSVLILDCAMQDSRQFVAGMSNREALGQFRDTYLARTVEVSPIDLDALPAWLPPLAAVRLGEGIAEECDYLLSLIRDALD